MYQLLFDKPCEVKTALFLLAVRSERKRLLVYAVPIEVVKIESTDSWSVKVIIRMYAFATFHLVFLSMVWRKC